MGAQVWYIGEIKTKDRKTRDMAQQQINIAFPFFLPTHSVTLATLARFFTQMETQPVISTQPPSALSVQSITVH